MRKYGQFTISNKGQPCARPVSNVFVTRKRLTSFKPRVFAANFSGTNGLKNTFDRYVRVGFRGLMAYADVYLVCSSSFHSQQPNAIFFFFLLSFPFLPSFFLFFFFSLFFCFTHYFILLALALACVQLRSPFGGVVRSHVRAARYYGERKRRGRKPPLARAFSRGSRHSPNSPVSI